MASSSSSAAPMQNPRVVAIVDASFEEQTSEIAAFLSRSKPEAERNDFIASFRPAASSAAATAGDEDAGEDEKAKEAAAQDVPIEERKSLVDKLVAEVKDAGEGSDKDIEGAFNLLTSLVVESFAEQQSKQEELLSHISKAVTSNAGSSEKNTVKYRVLSNIFNTLPETSALRCTIFLSLLSFARSNDELELLSSSLTQLPTWLAQWQVSPEQRESCLAAVAEALNDAASAEAGGDLETQKKAYDFQLLYLRFLSAGGASFESKAKQTAEKIIAQAVSFPSIFDFESLLQIEAVAKLTQDQSSAVGGLLRILSGGSAKEYKEWISKNQAEVKRLGLPEEQVDRKIRLLDLASLCASSLSKEISYKTVADTISVSEDEVEVWVIDVIRAGLVSGKLSQVNQTFRVYRSTHRVFGKEQWTTLEERLVEWQGAISRILETITESRPAVSAASSAPAVQSSEGQNAASSGEGISVA